MSLQQTKLIQYNFVNNTEFQGVLKSAIKQIGNLKWALQRISEDFYISEKAIFQLKSRGGYTDLDDVYAKRKQKKFGFTYPILKATGRLEKAITSKNSPDSINIVGKQTLIIGEKTGYGIYHNSNKTPRKKIPQRMFVFIGPESRWFASKDRAKGGGRLTRWTATIEGYMERVMTSKGFQSRRKK